MRIFSVGWVAALLAVAGAADAQAQLLKPKCIPVAPLGNCPPGTDPFLGPVAPGTVPNSALPNSGNPNTGNPGDPANPNANNPAQPGQNDPLNNAFAQGNEGGGASPSSFNDNFNGDFGGIFVTRRVQVGSNTVSQSQVVGSTLVTTTTTVPVYRNVTVPLAARYNGVLVTDNDSPRPVDRAYIGYNYYNGIGTSFNSGFDRIDMHRQTAGFEKTFLGGDASFGIRLPFIQLTGGPPGTAQSVVGDLTVLLKYAFYNNRQTGDVASVGMLVTAPTGGGNNYVLTDGTTPAKDVLLQPWLGGVKLFQSGYAQGITSLLIPTDSRDPLLFNNSIGLGYFLYQNPGDRLINALVPFVEAHVRTPLNHRDSDSAIFFQDQLNMTFGTHFRFNNATVSPGYSVPLVKPQPYNGEFNLMLNVRF